MADFVSVLRKVIDSLGDKPTPEMRARVYEKARTTVAAKLAAISPPPRAAIVRRQKRSLEDAITQVELEYRRARPMHDRSDPLAELEEVFASLQATSDDKPVSPQSTVTPTGIPAIEAFEIEAFENPGPSSTGAEASAMNTTDTRAKGAMRPKPPEPEVKEGPNYQIRSGKIAGAISPPGDAEMVVQTGLHNRLRTIIRDALPRLVKIENRYPQFVQTIREYESLIEKPINELNVQDIWSVGSALHAYGVAYREQNVSRTLAEPLEPELDGIVQSITRLHGAFIMGFEEGRDLVAKADRFLADIRLVGEIENPGVRLLETIALNKDIVESRTLDANRPVRDFIHEFGWSTSRTGYSAYVIVRNIILSLVRTTVDKTFGKEPTAGAVISTAYVISAAAGDPSAEFIRTAIPLILREASFILAFANHSPEFRSYIEWAIGVIEDDERSRS